LQSKYKELYSFSHQYKNIFVNNFNFLIYKNENSKKEEVVVGQLMTTPNENWSVLAL